MSRRRASRARPLRPAPLHQRLEREIREQHQPGERASPSEALGGKLVADLLERGHFDRLMAVNLHTPSLEGCFSVPLEHLNAGTMLAEAARPYAGPGAVVSPDLGAVKLAERYARQLGLPLAIVHKSRVSGSEVSVQGLVGEVRGLRPIIVGWGSNDQGQLANSELTAYSQSSGNTPTRPQSHPVRFVLSRIS